MGYTIARIRATPAGNVTYELVLDDLTRRSVTIARKHATADYIDTVITHALANVVRPVKAL